MFHPSHDSLKHDLLRGHVKLVLTHNFANLKYRMKGGNYSLGQIICIAGWVYSISRTRSLLLQRPYTFFRGGVIKEPGMRTKYFQNEKVPDERVAVSQVSLCALPIAF